MSASGLGIAATEGAASEAALSCRAVEDLFSDTAKALKDGSVDVPAVSTGSGVESAALSTTSWTSVATASGLSGVVAVCAVHDSR